MAKDMYHNPNLNLKEWWKRIPDSKDYGTTKHVEKFSYELCASCESDLVNNECPICEGDD